MKRTKVTAKNTLISRVPGLALLVNVVLIAALLWAVGVGVAYALNDPCDTARNVPVVGAAVPDCYPR